MNPMPNTFQNIAALQRFTNSKNYATFDGVVIFKYARMFWYFAQEEKRLRLLMSTTRNLAIAK